MRSHRLGAGANNKGHRRKERLRLKCPTFRPKHDLDHTSTNEDDLLRSLGVPEDTSNLDQFLQDSETCRTTSSSGPLRENVMARITIDDKDWSRRESGVHETHEREICAPKLALCS